MKRKKTNRIVGIIVCFLLLSVFPAMAEDVTLNPIPPTTAGSFKQISWSSSGAFEPNASLGLYSDGIFNRTIVDATPLAIGSYYWAIPLSLQGLYQINITATTTIGQVLTNTTDINITTPTTDGCRYCHTTTGTNNSGVFDNTLGDMRARHHNLVQTSQINPMTNTPYTCADCHPANVSGGGILIDRYCLDCHNGSAFWANPTKINPGEPHINIAQPIPVINSVTLSSYTPNTGDSILVTVNATDGISITSVTANGVSLTKQYDDNHLWNGNITAIDGTHSVNVSAIDSAGQVTWDNSTSYTATTPPPDTPPVINGVTLSTNTPNTGDLILVTVNTTDDVLVTNVMANGVSLTKQSNEIWNGNITAIDGTHSVNVSASDGAGHVTWDNSTSYTATTPPPSPPNIIVTSPMTGDNWARGTTQTIRWTYTGDLGNSATVDLLKQDGRVAKTWSNVPQANGAGSLEWAIPSGFEVSTYHIRVSAGGYSNTTGNFNIVKR